MEQELHLTRPPEQVLAEAQRAARALKDVVAKKAKPVLMKGEQYLEFEDWQTVGRFYGITSRTVWSRPVMVGEATGWEARAEAIDVRTGQVLSSAEAMCLNDEPNWKGKPSFQLRSMAQTRACAKTLRNLLAWVVVLAGYRPTPAEEIAGMQDTESARTPPTRTEPHEAGEDLPPKDEGAKYRKRVFARLSEIAAPFGKEGKKVFDEVAAEVMHTIFGVKSREEMTPEQWAYWAQEENLERLAKAVIQGMHQKLDTPAEAAEAKGA
jgi:hypothetical protein